MEDEKTEYKKSLAVIDEILETVVAFANTSGGEVFVGVDDSGNAVGVSLGRNTIENLATTISREIDPRVTVSLKTAESDDKIIVIIAVPMSPLKPHFFKSIAYKRVGKTNLKLSSAELEAMFISRALSLHDVDSLHLSISIDDISQNLLKEYVHEIGKKYKGAADTLRNLGLKDNGKIHPAAVIFFGNNPSRFFPLYGVKCAVFRGNEMLAMRDFPLPVYEVVAPVMNFIKQNIPFGIRFQGVKRYEEPKIPGTAIREALLNALIHADYTLDATVYVRITEDFVEIKNGGVLPPPLTLEELRIPHISKPRNKRIAALCHNIGWIEHWGEGTLKIIREMDIRGLDADFNEKNGYFSVRLSAREISLNERQQNILQKIRDSGSASVSQLVSPGLPGRTVRADLALLVKKGFVKKEGTGRLTHYTL